MEYLKTAYEKARSKGLLKTDKIWFNLGHRFDLFCNRPIDDSIEIRFADLSESLKKMRVSENEFEAGSKAAWIEDGQLCVGKDSDPVNYWAFADMKKEGGR